MTQVLREARRSDILDFPGYLISDCGEVINTRTGCLVKVTRNSHGAYIVGLMKDGRQHKRSLARLVACAFLPSPKNESFDTPIHLDGDRANVHYQNLMWRPLWFSRKYMRQFNDNHTTYDGPIEDVETRDIYSNSMHASMHNGVLDNEIYLSMLNNSYVWPTGQVFRMAINR